MPVFAQPIDLKAAAALDKRSVVATIAERDALLVYEGLETWVTGTQKKYRYTNGAWAEVGEGGSGSGGSSVTVAAQASDANLVDVTVDGVKTEGLVKKGYVDGRVGINDIIDFGYHYKIHARNQNIGTEGVVPIDTIKTYIQNGLVKVTDVATINGKSLLNGGNINTNSISMNDACDSVYYLEDILDSIKEDGYYKGDCVRYNANGFVCAKIEITTTLVIRFLCEQGWAAKCFIADEEGTVIEYLYTTESLGEEKTIEYDGEKRYLYYTTKIASTSAIAIDYYIKKPTFISANDIANVINSYQSKLISGTNIKTLNNMSLLGNGNINLPDIREDIKYKEIDFTEFTNNPSELFGDDFNNDTPIEVSKLSIKTVADIDNVIIYVASYIGDGNSTSIIYKITDIITTGIAAQANKVTDILVNFTLPINGHVAINGKLYYNGQADASLRRPLQGWRNFPTALSDNYTVVGQRISNGNYCSAIQLYYKGNLKETIDSEIELKAKESITNTLAGKKIMAIGDSMTFGHNITGINNWLGKIGERNGMIYDNRGTNGAYMSDYQYSSKNNSVYQKLCVSDSEFYISDDDISIQDYIVIFAGTNDSAARKTIGDGGGTDYTQFKNALEIITDTLQTRAPKAKICFFTPYKKTGSNSDSSAYIQAIEDVCGERGIPVFNNKKNGGINFANTAQYTALTLQDGYHLNADGMEYASRKYEAFLRTL